MEKKIELKRLCVFCGSSLGSRPEYARAARDLGRALADRNIGLVYGGARVGIMGELADSVLAAGGSVTGVIPQFLMDKEVAHRGITDLMVVPSMHERKAKMSELADGFIALPGGLGTLEEFFEVLTWAQLSMHQKPCGLLDVCQYFQKLIEFLDHVTSQKFLKAEHRTLVLIGDNPEKLIDQLHDYRPVHSAKWLGLDKKDHGLGI